MSYPQMSTTVPWSLVKDGFKKTPHFNSLVQKTAAGRGRSAIALMPYPQWDFEVDLNFVSGGEAVQGSVLQQFLACYLQTCGAGGFFYFTDPNDSVVTDDQGIMLNVTPGAAAPMGQAGDGTSTQFQLARGIGSSLAVDVIQNPIGQVVNVAGTPTSVSVSSTGVVTFGTAPAEGAELTWNGAFQYLCQFTDDSLKDLARVNKNSGGFLWSCGSIAFESVFV